MLRLFLLALFVALPLSASAQEASAHSECPCAAYGPYPCAATTLVALADQAGPLGLTGAQLDDLQPLRDAHIRIIHEIQGDITSLQETLHDLDRPFDADEVFALFYDIGRHEAELDAAYRTAEEALLDVLSEDQRRLWHQMIDHGASLQETALAPEAP